MTIWEKLKSDWNIKKSEIMDLGINPNKNWGDITYNELAALADYLEVLICDLV